MPLRKKITKGKTKVKTTVKQAQNVRQSVKVVIEAPKRRAPRRPAKATQSDMLRGLMRAPEYTTFRDLTPTAPSTGYGQAPPNYPINNAPQQQRIEQQDQIGSVSGTIGLLKGLQLAGLLKGPVEEEKKSNEDDPEEVIVSGSGVQISPITGADIPESEQEKLRKALNAKKERERVAKKKQQAEEKAIEDYEREERMRQRKLENERIKQEKVAQDIKAQMEAIQAKEKEDKLASKGFRRATLLKDAFGTLRKAFQERKAIKKAQSLKKSLMLDKRPKKEETL
jgi:hypothetical protein